LHLGTAHVLVNKRQPTFEMVVNPAVVPPEYQLDVPELYIGEVDGFQSGDDFFSVASTQGEDASPPRTRTRSSAPTFA
jgi:hypothetical protein